MTVLFCDLVDSTALGESLDPEPLRDILSTYFGTVSDIIVRHGGKVEKFIGDAVMSVFGVPTVYGDEALRAARAALAIRGRVAEMDVDVKRRFGVTLRIRIGINSGEVAVGARPDGELGVTGDTVNTAARLQTAAPPEGIYLGDAVHRLLGGLGKVRPVPPVAAKGKAEPVPAWSLLGIAAVPEDGAAQVPLVGRDAELALLRDALAEVTRSGRTGAVEVTGPPGIGKSRLVSHFAASLPASLRVLTGHCLAYLPGAAFHPVAEQMEQLAGPEWAARHDTLLPEAADAALVVAKLAVATGGDPEGSTSEQETAWAVRRLLEELTRPGPVLAVFEDFDAATPTLAEVLAAVMDRLARPVLFVFVSRQPLPDALAQRAACSIGVEPLSRQESLELAATLRGEVVAHAAAPGLLDRVVDVSEGVPLYIEQLLAVSDAAGLATDSVPLSVQAVLEAQLDRLDGTDRDVLTRASVIGREFGYAGLHAVSEQQDRERINEALRRLLRRRVIATEPHRRADLTGYRFSHLLLWETTYRTASKQARAALHERFARWLVDGAGIAPEALTGLAAHHLAESARLTAEVSGAEERVAELAQEAGEHFLTAAALAQRQGDLSSAVSLFEQGRDTLRAGSPQQLETALRLADCLHQLRGSAAAREALCRATESLPDNQDWAMLAALRTAMFDLATDPAQQPHAIALADSAAAYFTERGLAAGLRLAHELRAHCAALCSRRGEAVHEVSRALEYARGGPDGTEELRLLSLRCELELWSDVPVRDAVARCDALLLRGDLDRRQALPVMAARGVLSALDGDFATARSMVSAARSIAAEMGLRRVGAGLAVHAGLIETYADRHEAADTAFAEGLAYFERTEERLPTLTFRLARARLLVVTRRFPEAAELLRAIAGQATPLSPNARVLADQLTARVAAAEGRHPVAARLAQSAVTAVHRTDDLVSQGDALMDQAEVLVLAGELERAAETMARAEQRYLRKGARVPARKCATRRLALAPDC